MIESTRMISKANRNKQYGRSTKTKQNTHLKTSNQHQQCKKACAHTQNTKASDGAFLYERKRKNVSSRQPSFFAACLCGRKSHVHTLRNIAFVPRSWEICAIDVHKTAIVCFPLPSFCLVPTPPVIAKMLGKDFSIREIEQVMASSMCGVLFQLTAHMVCFCLLLKSSSCFQSYPLHLSKPNVSPAG